MKVEGNNMPYNSYYEIATGNEVKAIQCGHDGIVLSLLHLGPLSRFQEGDWIVQEPDTFEGKPPEKIIRKADFLRLYRLARKEVKGEEYWKRMWKGQL